MNKAVIVGLVRGHPSIYGYRKLIHRNRLLHRNFNKKFNYPVLIFHEGNILSSHQNVISKITPNIKFIDVSNCAFEMPIDLPLDWQTQIGYKHMCRFYALQIYELLSEFDYFLRLDDDSYIESQIRYDMFEFMIKGGFEYGYIHKEMDYHQDTIETLPQFTRNYIQKNNIKINCDLEDIDTHYFYSNFMITKIDFWLRTEVQNFLKAIDNSLGIYQYRWGDHIIQTHAIKMFSQRERIYHFKDFHYFHRSHNWANYNKKIIRMPFPKTFKRIKRRFNIIYLNYLLNQTIETNKNDRRD
jgi:hypothetical protein